MLSSKRMLILRNISFKIVSFSGGKSVHSRMMVFSVLCKSPRVVPSGGERRYAVARAGYRLARGCLISTHHKPRSVHPPGADVDKEPEQDDACSSYSGSLRPPTVHRLGKTNTGSHCKSQRIALCSLQISFAYFLTSRPYTPRSRSVWCLSYDAHVCQLNALSDSFSVLCVILGLSAPGNVTRYGTKVWQIR